MSVFFHKGRRVLREAGSVILCKVLQTLVKSQPAKPSTAVKRRKYLILQVYCSPSAASSLFLSLLDKSNKGGVISGIIVGVILVSVLIGLIGYAVCGKRRSQSFSHRRFYDETRNDPGKAQHKCSA